MQVQVQGQVHVHVHVQVQLQVHVQGHQPPIRPCTGSSHRQDDSCLHSDTGSHWCSSPHVYPEGRAPRTGLPSTRSGSCRRQTRCRTQRCCCTWATEVSSQTLDNHDLNWWQVPAGFSTAEAVGVLRTGQVTGVAPPAWGAGAGPGHRVAGAMVTAAGLLATGAPPALGTGWAGSRSGPWLPRYMYIQVLQVGPP